MVCIYYVFLIATLGNLAITEPLNTINVFQEVRIHSIVLVNIVQQCVVRPKIAVMQHTCPGL